MFLNELKNFSRSNWWIYLLLAIALIIVYITGKGNMLEIIILFLANFLGNLFIMVMQANYTSKNNKIGAIYHISSVSVFTILSFYSAIKLEQSQYIIWQICYILAALKAFTYYNYGKEIRFLNAGSVGLFNLFLIFIFIFFAGKQIDLGLFSLNFNVELGTILMALGFSFVTSGLVSINDKLRYWLNIIGVLGIVAGSGILLVLSFINGNIDGISLGYFILTSTVLVYYIKLLPKYLKCKNS
ncbi:MAG: hypothetical protein PHI37_00295 [Candidatus Gracilibacteria bacterium]|nr:hypothetical protein [Candidatus Gracilibacteria bacterium]